MQLPPLQVTRAVVQRYCRLIHRYKDDLGERPLVLPTGDFFPDQFRGDLDSVRALVQRMQGHAGLSDVPVTVELVDQATLGSTGSCSSGGCGVPQNGGGLERLADLGDAWLLRVPTFELRHPVALTTNLVRSLSYIFLVESQTEGEVLEPPVDVTADLVAVALGFGPLMLQGSYIYAKGCSGPQVASVTKISVAELAIAVALFSLLGQHTITSALKELDVTQRSLCAEAHELLNSNPALIQNIRRSPLSVSTQPFDLVPPRSFIGRFFSSRKPKAGKLGGIRMDAISADLELDEVEALLIDMPPSSRAGRAQLRPSRRPDQDELSALVAESLNAQSLNKLGA